MISLKLTETKNLCLNFFYQSFFDHFSFSLKVILSPFNSFHIDGYIQKDFYAEFPPEELFLLLPLSPVLRHFQNILTGNKYANIVFFLIKRKRTPLSELQVCVPPFPRQISQN